MEAAFTGNGNKTLLLALQKKSVSAKLYQELWTLTIVSSIVKVQCRKIRVKYLQEFTN
jgi:hypothetical protein